MCGSGNCLLPSPKVVQAAVVNLESWALSTMSSDAGPTGWMLGTLPILMFFAVVIRAGVTELFAVLWWTLCCGQS